MRAMLVCVWSIALAACAASSPTPATPSNATVLHNMLTDAVMPPLDGNEAAAARRRACETGMTQDCDAATP